jgi:hypothetical protein
MTEFVLRTWAPPGETAIAGPDTVINTVAAIAEGKWPEHGNYVASYTPHGHGGRGSWRFTGELTKAKRFPSYEAAFEAWREPSNTHPRRVDGRPNRPLTMFNVTIEPVEKA